MKVIYENQVKAAGECVEEFKDAGMFIIFGENAPDEIKDYCYSVSVNPINGEIAPGQYVVCRLRGPHHPQGSGPLHIQLQRRNRGRASRHHLCRGQAHA